MLSYVYIYAYMFLHIDSIYCIEYYLMTFYSS